MTKAHIRYATPLRYADEQSQHDLPPQVRGASSLRWWNQDLILVQDDISALVVVSPEAPHAARPLLLPRGHQGRRTFGEATGNKPYKRDLEASLILPDGRYVAWGSGSGQLPDREFLVLLHHDESLHEFPAHDFYGYLRQEKPFAGEDLNIEGTLVVGEHIWLLQRGNSAQSHNAIGVIQIVDLVTYLHGGPHPQLQQIVPVDLGHIQHIAWGITDAAMTPNGEIYVIASAEDTDNPYDDGDILGSQLFVLHGDALTDATWEPIPITDEHDGPNDRKIEGLVCAKNTALNEPLRFWAVTDADDEQATSELLLIEVHP